MDKDFVPSLRSLYLSSLPNDSKAYQQGEQYLLRNQPQNIQSIKNKEFKENKNIATALKVLEDAINKERENEQQYFTNFLDTHNIDNETKQSLSKEIQKLFASDNSFNYDDFLKLVNQIITGKKQFEAILELEEKRLKELKAVFEKIPIDELDPTKREEKRLKREQRAKKSNKELKEENRPDTKAGIEKRIRQEYLEKHTYGHTIYANYFNNITPTIDYLLADYLRRLLFQILSDPETVNEIQDKFKADKLTEAQLNQYIFRAATKQSNHIIDDVVAQAISNKKIEDPTPQAIEDFVKNAEIIDIIGQPNMMKITKNFIIEEEGKLTALGQEATNKLQLLLNTMGPEERSQGVVQELLNTTMNYNFNKNSKSDMTALTIEEAIKTLNDIYNTIKELENTSELKELSSIEKQLLTDYKNTARMFKSKISRRIKNKLDEMLAGKIRSQLDNDFNRFLSKTTITINGPQLSEFLDTVVQKGDLFKAIQTGQQNAKADTIIISLIPPEANTIKTNINFKNITPNIIKEYNSAISEEIGNFYQTFQDGISKKGNATNYAKGKTAWFNAIEKLYTNVQDKLQNNIEQEKKELPDLESLAKVIEQSIVVTNTMKTFNNYNNDIGFLSGSLGPNLISQINNFAELFASAGVPMSSDEIEWLEIAMVNCSSEAIGITNKDPIERYLSLMAGFALFDEGSAEVEIIATAGKVNNFYVNHSPKIMHLYKLNGLYYPGSYILTRIKEHLTGISNQIQSDMLNNDGAIIDARGDEKLVSSYGGADPKTTWDKIYNAALKVTNVRVAFLSGLLDVVNKLGNFSNVEE